MYSKSCRTNKAAIYAKIQSKSLTTDIFVISRNCVISFILTSGSIKKKKNVSLTKTAENVKLGFVYENCQIECE